PRKSPARPVIIAVSVALFLVVAAAVGMSIANGIERSRIEQEVKTLLENAEAAFAGTGVDPAAELAQKAQHMLDTSPQTLNPELVRQWQARIAHFTATKEEADKLQAIFADADKDPAGARSRLENKRALYGAETPDNHPLVARVENLLAEIGKLELKRKHEKLAQELQAADALYKQGRIEAAAGSAAEIAKKMLDKPSVQDPDLDKRLTILRKRAEQLKAMKDVRMAARGDAYAEARRKIQAQLDALDEKNEDLRPLCRRFAELKDELIEEEKRSRKLGKEELAKLKTLGQSLGMLGNNKAWLDSFQGKKIAAGAIEGDTIGLTYDDKPLRLGFQRGALGESLFLEVNGYRLAVELRDLDRRTARVLAHALALGEAMKKAGIPTQDLWSAADEAPLPSARRTGDDGKEYIFLGDRLYCGLPQVKTASEKETEDDFNKKARALAAAVESDTGAKEEVRRVVAVAVRATDGSKKADWFDHLPGEFVREVVNEGYIEANMPGAGERLKKELTAYREAFAKITHPWVCFNGVSPQGDEAAEMRTFEEHAVWRLYNKAAGATTFAVKNPDDERGALFVLCDFPGKVAEYTSALEPKTVRMTHQAVGVTATYDVTADKMTYDKAAWELAVLLESPLMPPEIRVGKGFGPPGWCLPPHVLLLDMMGSTKAIVTPFGRLDVQNFNEIEDTGKRMGAMNAFLKKMAKVLPTANYLHLYFRYFFEYILDSPITSLPNLLGSRAHCGDIHQTTFESLQRFMGGRYVGDCDDLAEFFMTLARRQNKLSYVMALPQHAACGWVEKPQGADEYTFYVLDTGPGRMFKHRELDKAIESAFRAYDEEKTMRFDPKSLGFLFRFNNEPTRSPYWLSSRMYVDPVYGDVMERVQGHWHFHFYALGIETMTQMIEKGDRVPENCIELAGLYGQVRETESSIHWTNEAIKQFGPDEELSRMNEEFRIALMWREEHDNQKSYDSMKPMIARLKELQSTPQSQNFISVRLQTMGLLISIDRPWEAWDLVARDMTMFATRGRLKIEHTGGLTSAYEKMKRLIAEGKQPTAEEADKLNKLERLLAWFYEKALFEREDDFNDYMRKYAFLGLWYAGKYGHQRLVAELLKPGPFPDPNKPRVHQDRKTPEEEDWKWIRLSLPSYAMAIGDAIDLDDPPEKWRREEAVKLADAMVKAADEARKFGSLSGAEFQLLSIRVFRAFLVKDWADYEKVLAITKERNWARLTTDIAEATGRGARFVTPDEFVAQYRLFTKYITARTAYFTVVYEAYRAEGIEHAVRASKVAVQCCPNDEDMKREVKYLEQLAQKRLAKTKTAAKPGPAPDAKKDAPPAPAPAEAKK
ncbi:MAG: hypothetical protein NTW87_28000, partial [Planctomycetota bacterium]|nr:hypothetical protein [Planctomycetota bacterium]